MTQAFAWRLYSRRVAPTRFLSYIEAVATDRSRVSGRRHDIAWGRRCKKVVVVGSKREREIQVK